MLFVKDIWLKLINEFAKTMESVAAAIPETFDRATMDHPRGVMTVEVDYAGDSQVAAAFCAKVVLVPMLCCKVAFVLRIDNAQMAETKQYRQLIQVVYSTEVFRNPQASCTSRHDYVVTKSTSRMRPQEDLLALAQALALHCAGPYLRDGEVPSHELIQGHLNALFQ
jgi:hypothetical protein